MGTNGKQKNPEMTGENEKGKEIWSRQKHEQDTELNNKQYYIFHEKNDVRNQ